MILLDSAPEVGCFLIVGLAIILEVTFFSSSGFFAVYTVGLLFFSSSIYGFVKPGFTTLETGFAAIVVLSLSGLVSLSVVDFAPIRSKRSRPFNAVNLKVLTS